MILIKRRKLKTYKIESGDTLQSISEKFGITPVELKAFHNTHCDLKDLIGGNDLPKHLNEILIDENWKEVSIEIIKTVNEKEFEKIEFEHQARYRCEQINTTKINGNLVQYLEQKFQYLLKINLTSKRAYIKLEDNLRKLSPPILNDVFDFIDQTDKIRHNVHLELNHSNGFVKDVINKKEITNNWNKFKLNKALNTPYLIELKNSNEKGFYDILRLGDIQFSFKSNFLDEYQKDFFYQSCFDQYLYNDVYQIIEQDFLSTIVPPIVVPLKIRYDKVSENGKIVTLRKVAEYNLNNEELNKIIGKYNDLHKNVIGYNFTEYKLIFRSTIEFDSETKIINNAKIVLKESILDNIENECNYIIKKLENYIPYENE